MMVSQEWLDQYFDRAVDRHLKGWEPQGDPVLSGRTRTYLRRGLKLLNCLPENDPFWINTNREPTLYKLQDYFQEQLKSDPNHDEYRWILMSHNLLHGADMQLGWNLKPLLQRDFANVEWLMAAGLWIRGSSGFVNGSSLRDLLADLRDQLPTLKERLDSLRREATAHRLLMVDEALNLNSAAWAVALSPPAES